MTLKTSTPVEFAARTSPVPYSDEVTTSPEASELVRSVDALAVTADPVLGSDLPAVEAVADICTSVVEVTLGTLPGTMLIMTCWKV